MNLSENAVVQKLKLSYLFGESNLKVLAICTICLAENEKKMMARNLK